MLISTDRLDAPNTEPVLTTIEKGPRVVVGGGRASWTAVRAYR
jgi:hypothetical protein